MKGHQCQRNTGRTVTSFAEAGGLTPSPVVVAAQLDELAAAEKAWGRVLGSAHASAKVAAPTVGPGVSFPYTSHTQGIPCLVVAELP